MERRLYEAASEGNVVFLLELLQEDALILDRVVTSMETPLHIAVMRGHVTFVNEILNRKPELAGEFDYQRCSPLHLASAKGDVEIVKSLLSINPSVCLVCDREGRTPLHLAAMKGRIEVLNELVRAKPEACRIGDYRHKRTPLHLCITHSHFEALKLLADSTSDVEIVNLKDGDGNSLLHLAVINKQLEMLDFLLKNTKINVNMLNTYGFTALDVLSQSPRDLKDMDILVSLQRAGAMRAKDESLGKNTRRNDQISILDEPFQAKRSGAENTRRNDQISILDEPSQAKRSGAENTRRNDQISILVEPSQAKRSGAEKDPKKKDDWVRKKHNTLMVVASLIATMAFQAGVNPPSGLLPNDGRQGNLGHNSVVAAMPPNSQGNLGRNSVVPAMAPDSQGNNTEDKKLVDPFWSSKEVFLASNTVGFLASSSIILLLISGLPLKHRFFVWILMVIMWAAITAMALTYLLSITSTFKLVEHRHYSLISLVVLSWIGLMFLLLLCHTIRLVVWLFKMFSRFIWRIIICGWSCVKVVAS